MENNKMFKSLYDRILSVKFLNTVLIGCAVMGGACSLSHPITDMTTKEKAWEEFSHPVDSTRTKVWWFHGETETTREGITADLEASSVPELEGWYITTRFMERRRMRCLHYLRHGGICCALQHLKPNVSDFPLK